MLLITTTTGFVSVITSAATAVDVHASYVDNASGTITPGVKNTVITTAVAAPGTTVVAAPAASTQRNVQHLIIRNKDAATSNTITVRHSDGTTAVDIFSVGLAAGEHLEFVYGKGWIVIDATGGERVASSAGRIARIFHTGNGAGGATGNLIVSAQTTQLRVVMIGGGGGGGGAAGASASTASVGGGGGAGGYLEFTINVSPGGVYAYAYGAPGAGGTAGSAGSAGSATTLTVGATTYSAPGGAGGGTLAAGSTAVAVAGGAGGSTFTAPAAQTLISSGPGAAGSPGIRLSGTAVIAGQGGAGYWGGIYTPALLATGSGTQNATTSGAWGAGGNGGASTSTGAGSGASGIGGYLFVEELT